jgi:hypothetical protein
MFECQPAMEEMMALKKTLVAGVTAFSLLAGSASGALADADPVEDDGGDAAVLVIVGLAALILFGGLGQPAVPAGG